MSPSRNGSWASGRTYDGLRIEPVIPPEWQGFSATRLYRGVRYEIQVVREGDGNEVRLEVDGKAVEGTVVPLPAGWDQPNPGGGEDWALLNGKIVAKLDMADVRGLLFREPF